MPTVRDVMTPNPYTLTPDTTVEDAARTMATGDVGDVLVAEGDRVVGIVTDRDIVVRALAEGRSPAQTRVSDICSADLTTVPPDADADEAARLMREKAIRRIPVVEGGRPVGIVSIGDLAIQQDPSSALADVSAAPPNV